MGLLLPSNPEFQALLKKSKTAFSNYAGASDADMSATYDATAVPWAVVKYDMFEVHHAIIEQNDSVSKIVFHFKKIAHRTADKLSRYLYDEIARKMKPKAAVQAGESPEFRSQWDLILFHVPVFEVKMLHTQLLALIETFVGK
jgi:hypothetical protein